MRKFHNLSYRETCNDIEIRTLIVLSSITTYSNTRPGRIDLVPTQQLMKHRLHQSSLRFVTRRKVCFQPVTEGHQFIDFGDDAVLLGKGREGETNRLRDPCP